MRSTRANVAPRLIYRIHKCWPHLASASVEFDSDSPELVSASQLQPTMPKEFEIAATSQNMARRVFEFAEFRSKAPNWPDALRPWQRSLETCGKFSGIRKPPMLCALEGGAGTQAGQSTTRGECRISGLLLSGRQRPLRRLDRAGPCRGPEARQCY